MDLGLRGAVVGVTAVASGIGRAYVDAFAAERARVAIFDRAAAGESVAWDVRDVGAETLFAATIAWDFGYLSRSALGTGDFTA